MLDTVLYVHIPLEEKPGQLRFVQFVRPENGQTVLPFFSDGLKAIEAAAGRVEVLPLLGRNLFAYTQGATLMLDPNERECVLYPEEIAALLTGAPMASVRGWETTAGETQAAFEPLGDLPEMFTVALSRISQHLPSVTSVYVARLRWVHSMEQPALMIAIVAEESDHDQVMRAIATAIRPSVDTLDCPVDLTLLTPSKYAEHPMVIHGTRVYCKPKQES